MLHQNLFPIADKSIFGKKKFSLSGNNVNACLDKNSSYHHLFFLHLPSITHSSLPRCLWCQKNQALKIITPKESGGAGNHRKGGRGSWVNLCDRGWRGPDKVSAHLFTPGGNEEIFFFKKRQQLHRSPSLRSHEWPNGRQLW